MLEHLPSKARTYPFTCMNTRIPRHQPLPSENSGYASAAFSTYCTVQVQHCTRYHRKAFLGLYYSPKSTSSIRVAPGTVGCFFFIGFAIFLPKSAVLRLRVPVSRCFFRTLLFGLLLFVLLVLAPLFVRIHVSLAFCFVVDGQRFCANGFL